MSRAKPTARQIEWADMEIGVIIHYIMDIYNPEFKGYKTNAVRTELSPDRFNPTHLDPEQWVRAAYELGAKYAVLVTNHCTGFSLWQTKVNDYSCASMKWKDGKGDILREFVDACNKYGIKPGVYYSTGCNGYYNINDEWEFDYKSEEYQAYVRCVEKQVEEIWSEYGEMFELWFDGGVVPHEKGGPDLMPLLKKYQPDAITFQGPVEASHNIRWVGNELGTAPENCRASVKADDRLSIYGDIDGELWIPAETDFPNRSQKAFGGGWGWREGEDHLVLTPRQLLDCYVTSVGRNTNMMVGMSISTDGDFQDEEQFIEFGKLLKKTFSDKICEIENTGETEITLSADGKTPLSYLVISEDIKEGEAVEKFTVFADGKKIYKGECIGHKRILPLNGLCANEIKVEINAAREGLLIKNAALYAAE